MSRWFKNNKSKYGIIRRADEKCGLGSYVITILGGINYCIEKGIVPIVDLEHYGNMYKEAISDNSWEHFFKQPFGVGLEVLKRNSKCELIEASGVTKRPRLLGDFWTNSDEIKLWRRIAKEYLVLSDDTRSIVDSFLDKYLPGETRNETIGVLARGTDYTSLRPSGHPIQPTVEELIFEIRKMSERTGYTRLFLATEDKMIYERLKEEFGNMLVSAECERFTHSDSTYLADELKNRSNVRMGREYLASLEVLAACKCLIAGKTSGSALVKILNDGFEEELVFDKGLYD